VIPDLIGLMYQYRSTGSIVVDPSKEFGESAFNEQL
jgi:hypothetical protein